MDQVQLSPCLHPGVPAKIPPTPTIPAFSFLVTSLLSKKHFTFSRHEREGGHREAMAGTDPVSEIRAHYYDELSEHFLNLFPLIGVVLGLLGYSSSENKGF